MNRLCAALAATCVMSGPAWADGSTKDVPTARQLACYLGVYGQGSYVRDETRIATVMDMAMGDAVTGGGPQVGCDVIVSERWLVGLVADYTWQATRFQQTMGGLVMSAPVSNEWSVRGRVGAFTTSARNTLLYVHGGVAGEVDANARIGAALTMPFSGGIGGVVGAGIETKLGGGQGNSGWYAFGEYGHEMFGDRTGTVVGVPTRVTNVEDRVRVGINFRY